MPASRENPAFAPRTWAWAAFFVALLVVAPAVTFLVNRQAGPPSGLPTASEESSPERDDGLEYRFQPLFTLGVGMGPDQVAPASTDPRTPTLDVVARDVAGRVWVVDHPPASEPEARVRVFDEKGALLSQFHTPSGATLFMPGMRDDLWLDMPAGSARGAEEVRRYSIDGDLLGTYPLPEGYLARFLRIDLDGDVYAYQEQWYINAETQVNEYNGTLLPIATGDPYTPVSGVDPFPGTLFGADDRLYVASGALEYAIESAQQLSVAAVSREGTTVAIHELPEEATPVGADAEGRLYSQVPPKNINEAPGLSVLGDVHREDAQIWVTGPDGFVAHMRVQMPPYVGGWPPAISVDPAGRVSALAWNDDGVTVGELVPVVPAREPAGSSAGDGSQSDAGMRPDLEIIVGQEPISGDPYAARDAADRDLMQLLYSGLVSLDASLTPRPVLATAVPQPGAGVSADGLRIEYTLTDGVRWHDGEPLTGDDVVATFEYLRANHADPRTEPFPGFSTIRSVSAEGMTVTVTLREPFGAGPECFFPYVLPAHLLREAAAATEETTGTPVSISEGGVPINAGIWCRPVGTGPYRLVRWSDGESWRLTAHDGAPGGAPAIERIDVRFMSPDAALARYQSAAVPTVWLGVDEAGATAITRDAIGTITSEETGRWRGILFGAASPLVSDAQTRRALALGYPRRALAADILPASTATDTVDLFPRESTAHDPTARPPASDDASAGARALREAGWDPGEDGLLYRDGARLELPLRAGRRGGVDEVSFEYVEAVTSAWSGMGALSSRSLSTLRFYDPWFTGGFLSAYPFAVAYGVFDGVPDPGWGGVLDPADAPGPTNPRGTGVGVSSGELQRLYRESRASYDRDERARIGREISRIAREDAHVIIERYETRRTAVIGRVEGMDAGPYPAGDLWNIADWRAF